MDMSEDKVIDGTAREIPAPEAGPVGGFPSGPG